MDNKQQITANNAELQKHKQDILDLPFADDVKNGRYVWEKYDIIPEMFTIHDSGNAIIALVNGAGKPLKDYSKVDLTGKIVKFPSNSVPNDPEPMIWEFVDNISKVNITGDFGTTSENTYSFDRNTGLIKITDRNLTLSSRHIEKPLNPKKFMNYTVSDNETAYPDGGEQGGYWYERVNINNALDGGTFTLPQATKTVTLDTHIKNPTGVLINMTGEISSLFSLVSYLYPVKDDVTALIAYNGSGSMHSGLSSTDKFVAEENKITVELYWSNSTKFDSGTQYQWIAW